MEQTYEQRREAEKTQEKAINDKLRLISKALGFTADETPDYRTTSLRLKKDDMTLHFYVASYSAQAFKKVRVSGSYPHDCKGQHVLYGKEHAQEIGVSLDKTAGQIARDIQRRFMPSYIEALKIAKDKAKQSEEAEGSRELLINNIATVLKIPYQSEIRGKDGRAADKARIYEWYGEDYKVERLQVETDHYAKTVKIEVDLKPAAAMKLIEALKPFIKGGK